MKTAEAKNKVAGMMGYSGWDNMIATCCSSNTPQVIYEAERKLSVMLPATHSAGLPSDTDGEPKISLKETVVKIVATLFNGYIDGLSNAQIEYEVSVLVGAYANAIGKWNYNRTRLASGKGWRNPESINETFEKAGIDISGKEDGCTEDRHVPGCRHEGENEPNKRLMK